jgi:maltooligosyltrehalose synthase
VLSEAPKEWRAAVARWSRENRKLRGVVSGRDEYLAYQTIIAAWPAELLAEELDEAALEAYRERIAAYMLKAAREAKLRTSWTNPDEAYETGLDGFVRAILDPARAPGFLKSIHNGARLLAAAGAINGLAQVVLRTTSPGVPDTYQGGEFWDLNLVDPDNRRPVDFAARDSALQVFDDALARGVTREELARDLLAAWPDGRIKLYLLATLLRYGVAAEWSRDGYEPLAASGSRAQHVIAYARGASVVVVPRLPWTLARDRPPLGAVWDDTAIVLPEDGTQRYREVLTDRIVVASAGDGPATLALAETLAVLPVAVLAPAQDDRDGDAKQQKETEGRTL